MEKTYRTHKAVFRLFMPLFLITLYHLNAVYIKKGDIRKSEKEMLQLINFERSSRGIKLLKFNSALFRAAELHNRKMIEMNKLSHTFKNYNRIDKRIRNVDVFFAKAGENIAFSTAYVSGYIHRGFMKSKPHKENILDKEFTHCGISIIETSKGFYITQEFAHILPPADKEDVEKKIKVLINNCYEKKYDIAPVYLSKYRKSLLKIAGKILNGEKIKNIPENIREFNMVNIASTSISEISGYLKKSIKGKKISNYSLAVIFGRSKKFIGGAYSVVFIFSTSEYKEIANTEEIEGKISANINEIRIRAGFRRIQKSKGLSRYAKKIALKYFSKPEKPVKKRGFNILAYQTDNPELIPEIHTAFFLSGKNRSSIGYYVFNPSEHGSRDNYYLLAFVFEL